MNDNSKDWKAQTGQKIECLYAWVAVEPDGGEGVCAWMLPGMPGMTPLIGADKARIESYRPFALAISMRSGMPVRLKQFGEGVTLQDFGPQVRS